MAAKISIFIQSHFEFCLNLKQKKKKKKKKKHFPGDVFLNKSWLICRRTWIHLYCWNKIRNKSGMIYVCISMIRAKHFSHIDLPTQKHYPDP